MATHTLPPPGTRRGGTATGCPAARPSRRDILGAAGFSALTGIAALAIAKPDTEAAEVMPAGPHPDAELLALADRFMALQAICDAVDAREREITDDDLDAVTGEQAVLLDKMTELVAMTPMGQRARARAFVAYYAIGSDERTGGHIHHSHLWPIVRDLMGKAA